MLEVHEDVHMRWMTVYVRHGDSIHGTRWRARVSEVSAWEAGQAG